MNEEHLTTHHAEALPLAGGVSGDNLRRQNLGQVLRLAHHSGPVSRAELTRTTGLNRSTIGGLVAELEERGLVREVAARQTRRVGRPSPMVVPSSRTVALAINPEVDATEVAVVALGGRVLQRVRHQHERTPTAREFVSMASAIITGMRAGLDEYRVLGIGLAVPGLVRSHDSSIALAPNLGWRDSPLAQWLFESTGMPVFVGNDANCGAVAESGFGVARDTSSAIYLNGGASGIGGGIVIDEAVVNGHSGIAGEFGHIFVRSEGVRCHCGATGCLETEVRRDRLLTTLGLDADQVDQLDDALVRAWQRGSGAGYQEIRRQLDYFCVGLRTMVNLFNPSCVVLGGFLRTFLTAVGEEEIKSVVGNTLPDGLSDVQLRPTTLGSELVLIGAAEKVFLPVLEDPTSVTSAPQTEDSLALSSQP